jgi:large subunit ribosomal protein L35
MPKIKTHRSTAKRVRVTKNGKVIGHQAFARHLKTHKSANRKRNLRKARLLSTSATRSIKRLLPYA